MIALDTRTHRKEMPVDRGEWRRAQLVTLYKTGRTGIGHFLRRRGVRPDHVDETVHDVFRVAWEKLSTWDENQRPLRAWVFGIARNVARDHRKLKRVRCELPTDPAQLPQLSNTAASMCLLRARILRAVAQLSPALRAAFEGLFLLGMTAPELAARDAVPVNTIYSRIRHVRLALRASPDLRQAAAEAYPTWGAQPG